MVNVYLRCMCIIIAIVAESKPVTLSQPSLEMSPVKSCSACNTSL